MDEKANESQTLFPHETGHHRSARERQRRGPMWGCLRALMLLIGGGFLILFLVVGGGWWYVGSTSFEDLIRRRIEQTLELRLGRDVTIKGVQIVRSRPQRVIINDLRIANAPGAVSPYFATVRQVEITGGIESFWGRRIRVGRIDIRDPRMNFEVFPAGATLQHNFPRWQPPKRGRYEIYRLDLGTLFITGGRFDFLDRRHNITAISENINSRVQVTSAEGLYAGVMNSPVVHVRIQDYEQFDVDLRGGFRYTPGVLVLESIALRGQGIEAFVSGRLDPLTEAAYNLRLTSQISLERVQQIFRVQRPLEGLLSLDTNLRGKAGDFSLTGGWVSPAITADTYELTSARGKLDVNGERMIIDVDRATYGGGNITAHYTLTQYAEPYPMSVNLEYDRISIEKLFSDWTIENTGLRGAATGRLTYRWNKDKLLDGSGEGTARLSRNTVVFSRARYPIPIAGSTIFALNRGVVTFRRAELDTDASHVSLTGTLRIEDVSTNLNVRINSRDFSELDRIGYNFAHSAGKRDYELLGLGGAGDITGTVRGPLKTPMVTAEIRGTGTKYNNVLLGSSDIALRYDGVKSVLTFDRAVFVDEGGRLAITGTIAFPDRGPSPRFDIAIEATNYPIGRAIAAVELDFDISGTGTGKLIVTGTPQDGKVTFLGLTVARGESQLRLQGDIDWNPGEGNVLFNLDIAAREFPVSDIMAFLDLGTFPVTGELTGTLHIEGPKRELEGAGAVTVRKGTIAGEPVEFASADIVFTRGRMRATNIVVRSAAGEITGEAELDLATERFSYTIQSGSLDLARLQILQQLRNLLPGTITITSSGAGTFEKPELMIEARLSREAAQTLGLPPDSPPPSIYFAIRNNQLIVRGSIGDILSVEGEGTVGPELAVDGLVRIVINDIARMMQIAPVTATVPAAGNAVIELRLGGKLTPLEALRVEGTVPTLNLRVSEHEFTAAEPMRFGLRGGRVVFDSFVLRHDNSMFTLEGFAELTGEKRLGLDVSGNLEAALLQLFISGLRADGHVDMRLAVRGTITNPSITGNAELQNARVKYEGFPQLIDKINGTLVFRGDRIEIDSLRATVGGGTVTAGGFVTVQGLRPQQVRLSINGERVAIRYFEGITVEGNFALTVRGDMERAVVRGAVDVSRTLYSRDFDFRQSLLNVLLSRRGVTPIAAARWQERVGLDVELRAPNGTLAVRNNIADVTGGAQLSLSGTLANPVVIGSVILNEGGTVTFQNIDYRVVRGTIDFQNPFRIDPYFDITLEGTVSGNFSEIESGPLDLTVNITGTIDRITPSITSDPPASDITLFSLLGLGALTRPSGTGPAVGNVFSQGLQAQLFSLIGSRFLPFADSFTYDPGLLDTGSGAGPRVTFEKRVSNEIRLLVVYNLDTHQSREVVEWLVNRDWTLQLTRDELSNEYRLDARFRRRYSGQWSWGNRGKEILPTGTRRAAPELPQPPPATAVQPIPEGTVVTSVAFHSDGRIDPSTLTEYIAVKTGQPLALRDVQSSIKSFFSTGNFSDVHADLRSSTGGAEVIFSLFLNYRVGDISFEGVEGGARSRAERELVIRRGEVLSLNAVDRSAVAIAEEFQRRGYVEATVDPETTFEREANLANVKFYVTLGPRAKVATVQIAGDARPFSETELIAQMRQTPGKSFSLNEAREDARRILNFLVRRDYRRAEVSFLEHTYDAATDSVALRYNVVVGPKVRVEVVGVPRNDVRRLIPFARNQEYSEDAIERAADNILRHYQQRGYINATVDTESELQGDTWVTTFRINPGQRFRLVDVRFTGNVILRDRELRRVISTAPVGGFRRLVSAIFRRPTGITREELNDDRDTLESHYRLQGFSEATVANPLVLTRPDGTMIVEFPINEGIQTLLADVRLEGVEKIDRDDLPELNLKPGQPYNLQLERSDVIALQSFYADRGFAEVQVAPRVDISADKKSATVTYTIAEGPQINIDQVVVRGNTYTDRDVVLRKAEIRTGDPFSYGSILEAQRNLYRLGIFGRVEVQPEQAGTSLSDRNVVITVEEGRNLTASGSVGLRMRRTGGQDENRVSPRFAGGIAHRNLFGSGRYLGLEAVVSGEENEFFLTYREPFLGRYNIPVQLSFFQSDDNTIRDRRIQQRGTSIEASRVAFLRTRWSVQYQYKISECKEGTLCDEIRQGQFIPNLDRSLLNIQISSITPTFFWDTRDDVIDPHRGFFTSASVEYAFPMFSADAAFTKEFVQGAYYLPLSQRSVLVVSSRVGLIQARGSSALGRNSVPPSERFTLGGDTSHRAYPLDLLGILCTDRGGTLVLDPENCRDTGLVDPDTGEPIILGGTLFDLDPDPNEFDLAPIGGNAMFGLNLEYRFPIFASVNGAIFADAGNVFADDTIRFDHLQYGIGAGIRYLSPVGPLRIDIGWPMQRRIYDRTFSYAVTLGFPF